MKINNLRLYVSYFFDDLGLTTDLEDGHAYKVFIQGAIDDFFDNESIETAYGVYQTFFDIYQNIDDGPKIPFIDLLDTLKIYEENAATLVDNQRDCFIHSVNVFLLGLAIFAENPHYRQTIDAFYLKDLAPVWIHTGKNEEFFFRWGIASLFHDIGYPAETTVNHVGKFLKIITSVDTNKPPVVHIGLDDFKKIDSISEIVDKSIFTKEYRERYPETKSLNLLKPTDILAHNLHLSFQVPLNDIVNALNTYIYELAESDLVDHGFYSSLIVLKWYGDIIQTSNQNPDILYYQILDSASAILLHTYYKNYFTSGKRFNHGPMHIEEHPLAWLLLLSNELQEWNRIASGALDKQKILAADVSLFIDENQIYITYSVAKGRMKEGFGTEKEADLKRLLYLDDIFSKGLSIDCETIGVLGLLAEVATKDEKLLPRLLIGNVEKLAIAIHDLYNKERLARNPTQKLEYPRFTDLPEYLKYSNLRQARDMVKKLRLIGCEMRSIGSSGTLVSSFDDADVEYLAQYEHDSWMNERIRLGWTYGPVKDVIKKHSPYLIPYSELTDEIKQLDRDTINNIPELLKLIGMAVYRADSPKKTKIN